jgi:malonyl-CoA O-methyltransferase
VTALSPREAYRLWAPRYEAETAVSFLEDRVVRALRVPVVGRRLVDVGCGTGRRLRRAGAAFAIGIDLTPEMLDPHTMSLAAADVRALPLATASFDVVWCRLVLGHVRELAAAYTELARICRPGGRVIVTDFHPDAVAAGHRRTFRDDRGTVYEIDHVVHSRETQEAVAASRGLGLVTMREGVVGAPVKSFYTRAGRLAAYRQQRGLKLVLALTFQRGA